MNRDESRPAPSTSYELKNLMRWQSQSDEYERQHAEALSGKLAMAWGLWRIPEAELHILGEVAGRYILELGCGAARWSIASFDIVFCDWGAMTFCDPHQTVPEAARLLRPGGLFAFATGAPLYFVCYDQQADVAREQLLNTYFDLHRVEWDDEVNFYLPYGEWIRLFRRHPFDSGGPGRDPASS